MNKKIILAIIVGLVALSAAAMVVLLPQPSQPVETQGELPFRAPQGLLITEDGNLYVSDSGQHTILLLSEGQADRVAGSILPQVGGIVPGAYSDGTAEESLFNQPSAMVEWLGGIVISDTGNNCLRFLKDGTVQTLAGTGVQGCENGDTNSATFYHPQGLAVGPDGALYLADSGNGCIRKITDQGMVETVLWGLGAPYGISWSGDVLYIADAERNQILSWDGQEVTVYAGLTGGETTEENAGFADGPADQAAFCSPTAILAQGDTLYVADTGNSAVRCIEKGEVKTLASFQGTGGELWPASPAGLAWEKGKLYVADPFAGVVFILDAPQE